MKDQENLESVTGQTTFEKALNAVVMQSNFVHRSEPLDYTCRMCVNYAVSRPYGGVVDKALSASAQR